MANANNTIDTAFVEEFESAIHMAYQRMGSKLRGTVRTREGVKNKTTFQKAGKGSASQKARGGKVAPMNVAHTNVNVTTEDWFAGEWIDDLDLLRVNHDEFQVAVNSGAWALGRKTDEQLFTAMASTTVNVDETTNGATLAWAINVFTKLGENDVPDDGARYAVVDYVNWGRLMQIDEFNRADFVGDTNVLPQGVTAKRWLGMTWMAHSGVPVNGSSQPLAKTYHQSAVGHAIGENISTNMQYYNERDSHFVLNKMQMNAVLIDENGCIESILKA